MSVGMVRSFGQIELADLLRRILHIAPRRVLCWSSLILQLNWPFVSGHLLVAQGIFVCLLVWGRRFRPLLYARFRCAEGAESQLSSASVLRDALDFRHDIC